MYMEDTQGMSKSQRADLDVQQDQVKGLEPVAVADHGMENKWEFTKISLVLSPGYEKSKVVSGDQLFLYGRLGRTD